MDRAFFFCFNDTATTEIYTLSLHDALPIFPYVYPDNDLSYTGNFLSMLFKMAEPRYEPDPRIEKALDVLFILHADHEQNCSAAAVRVVGSAINDPFTSVAAGVAGLYGPSHGGANVAVLKMLQRIGSTDNIPGFLQGVKDRKSVV